MLAAGASRRLGQAKQLVKIGGESLLRRTARIATAAGCAPVIVVLGYENERMAEEPADLDHVILTVNQDWEQGMSSSLRCGLSSLAPYDPESVLVLVCDQPRLSEATLCALIDYHTRTSPHITASSYQGVRGVPAIFDRSVFPELMQLTSDQGATRIISQEKWRVETVEFPGGEVDIDAPADLTSL